MSDVEVYVAVGEQNLLAGLMYPHHRRGIESASFVYNDRYLAGPDAYALDPAETWGRVTSSATPGAQIRSALTARSATSSLPNRCS